MASAPEISVIFEGEAKHNLPELKKKDEEQRELEEKHPIDLEAPVTHLSTRDYLSLLWSRYNGSNTRTEKSMILDEICRNLGYHRNFSLRLMRRPAGRKMREMVPHWLCFDEEQLRRIP